MNPNSNTVPASRLSSNPLEVRVQDVSDPDAVARALSILVTTLSNSSFTAQPETVAGTLMRTRPFRLLRPLQHFENAGEFLGFFNFLRFYYRVRHSVYCCHFSPFCKFLVQNSHSLLRSILLFVRKSDQKLGENKDCFLQ